MLARVPIISAYDPRMEKYVSLCISLIWNYNDDYRSCWQLPRTIPHTDPPLFHTRYLYYLVLYSNFMTTTPTFIFYLSDIIQSYPLYTHNTVLFLVSSWKQTLGTRRVVSVADRAWENIDLTFSSLWVRHSILITSTFGNCYDESLHLGIIKLFCGVVAGEQ